MSQNQSRTGNRDSQQHRKPGRPGSFNQYRDSREGGGGGGGSAPASGPSSPSSRSFNKKHHNAQGGYRTASGPSGSSARVVQNGARQEQSLSGGASEPPVVVPPSTTPVSNSDAPKQKTNRGVPRPPPSNFPAGPDSNVPGTPAKAPADGSGAFPLQFGSISPSFMNGMQVPPRTTSAPPNMDEQKRSQTAMPALPNPSISTRPPGKKDFEQSNNVKGSGPVVSMPKRDVPVSAPLTQMQKPSGIPMQAPFHPAQSQVLVQYGGRSQTESQTMPAASSLPIQMPVPLLLNPSFQQPMFVPGLPPHPMSSQGIWQQGPGLGFSSGINPHMPLQLGNMGMLAIPSQFPQQQAGMYGSLRKTVKIIDPKTHEELRLDGSPGPRSHPSMPLQSQPLSTFIPTSIDYYSNSNSYNNNSIFFQPPSSLLPNNSHISQGTRSYNQVTIKPAPSTPGEKDQVSVKDSHKHSKPQTVDSVFTQKVYHTSGQNSMLQPKQTFGSTTTPSIPEAIMHSSVVLGPSLEVPSPSSEIKDSMNVPTGSAEGLVFNAIREQQKKQSYIGPLAVQDQAVELSTSGQGSPSHPPGTEDKTRVYTVDDIDSKAKDVRIEDSSEPPGTKSEVDTDAVPETLSGNDKEAKMCFVSLQESNNSKTYPEFTCSESSELINQTEEGSLQRAASSSNDGSSVEITQEKVNESAMCSSEVDSSSSPSLDINGVASKGISLLSLSTQDHHIDTEKIAFPTTISVDEKLGSESCVSPFEATSKHRDEKSDNIYTASGAEKSLVDQDVPKSSAARGRKKKKELCEKADAAGATSDLYIAYKGTEEKKETHTYVESVGGDIAHSSNPLTADVGQDIMVNTEGVHIKAESDDWEDAVDVSSPKLEKSENEMQGVLEFKNSAQDGDEMTTKKYSRDFLLKFADQYTDLPEGFEIASDFAEALMNSDVGVSNEPYPNSGRILDRRPAGSRPERHTSGMGQLDMTYASNGMGFRPAQGGNFGGQKSNLTSPPLHYGGGILGGPLHSVAVQGGMHRNGVDADRWQRGTAFQKGLMASPQTPLQVMHKAENKYEVGKVTDEEQAKQRQLKAILNKLTPQNFEKLFQQVKVVNIDNVTTLSGVISQIFDKALMEPTFCEMYANFCFRLASELPDLSIDNEKITFKRLLLNKCQEEFERGKREEQEANLIDGEGETKLSDEEREEKRLKARRRMLGNIRLIGELYKKKMLTERIMHECIQNLLGESESQNPDEENIEALCKLMSTIGEVIDHAKAKVHMDAYFAGMANLSNNMKLSSRLRFMLKDAIDLRKNKWQQRRKVEGPKKIEEVHRDAAQERLTQASRTSRAPNVSSSGRRGQQMDFSPRGGGTSMFPSPSSQMGGPRHMPHIMRDYVGQDARPDDKNSFENRAISLPLTQRSVGHGITLGPQGGLAKGMSFRGHTTSSIIPSASIPNPGESNRVASGVHGFGPMTHGSREDAMQSFMPGKYSSHHDQTGKHDQNMHYGNRDHSFDTALPMSPPFRGGATASVMQNVVQDKVLPEERLQDLSMSAIKEFYSARDEKEIALCVKDLNTPSFYPSMISIWITDSFERKDMERDLLEKLLVNLTKSLDVILTPDQLVRGFECVLTTLEDAVNDAPRAAEFLGRIFAKTVLENVVSLDVVGKLLCEGGEEEGRLIETGLAADVLGSTLEMIKSEKGDSSLNDLCRRCNLVVESFRPPGSNKQSKLDKFLYLKAL